MKTKLEKGLNIIKGDFTRNTETNGQKVKYMLDKINGIMGTTLPKTIVPVSYGKNGAMNYILHDTNEILIFPAPLSENGFGEATKNTFVNIAKELSNMKTDKIIIFAIDVLSDDYPKDYAVDIVEAYGRECVVVEA